MSTVKELCQMGTEIEQALNLKEAPIALKVLYQGDEIPEGIY